MFNFSEFINNYPYVIWGVIVGVQVLLLWKARQMTREN